MNIYGVAQTNNYIRHHTLQKIEIILRENGSTLSNYPPLSTPNMDNMNIGRENSLILHDIRTYTIDEQHIFYRDNINKFKVHFHRYLICTLML